MAGAGQIAQHTAYLEAGGRLAVTDTAGQASIGWPQFFNASETAVTFEFPARRIIAETADGITLDL